MRIAATKYVYCLVPYADKATNADLRRRADVLQRFQHYVVGYDSERLTQLFPKPVHIAGTYWADSGQLFRNKISAMTDDEIRNSLEALKSEAMDDVKPGLPEGSKDCLGIRILSKI